MTHSTWQEKRKRVFGDETRRESSRREGGSAVVDERSSDRPREGGNAAGTYLGGTRARYPDTCRAHEAMDATTSRGLDESGRGGCVLCLRQKALFRVQKFLRAQTRVCSTFQIVWFLSYEPWFLETCNSKTRGSVGRSFSRDSRESHVRGTICGLGYFFRCVVRELFVACLTELRERPTLCADRPRAHVAARDHARGTRAREPPTPFGLGGGGVARCTAPGTARPPSAAATDTAVPKRRLFPSRVESGSRA